MTEAFIYDAVRTPRGKGKKDGALHSVKPVNLMAGVLRALQQRNQLDTAQVDDIVLGCVTPVATRARTSPRPLRWWPTGTSRSPACRSIASAPRAWRRSTWAL